MRQAKKCQDGPGGERSVMIRGLCVLSALFALAAVPPDPAFCQSSGTGKPVDPSDDNPASVAAYDAWAGGHEHIMAKSLFCAGTTWPCCCETTVSG